MSINYECLHDACWHHSGKTSPNCPRQAELSIRNPLLALAWFALIAKVRRLMGSE
jgi:hypothetical protein